MGLPKEQTQDILNAVSDFIEPKGLTFEDLQKMSPEEIQALLNNGPFNPDSKVINFFKNLLSSSNELETTIAIDPNDERFKAPEGYPIPEEPKPIIISTPIPDQDKDAGKLVTPIVEQDKNAGVYAGPEINVGNWRDNVLTADGAPPPNLSPEGAGRSGAFNEAKRNSGLPVTTQPDRVVDNYDRQGKKQEGRVYEFDIRQTNGDIKTIKIREDAGGHFYGENDSQNRGPHFNDDKGNHYDY